MQFVVTGTGRCGTRFMAETLQANGIQVGHEMWMPDGTSDFRYGAAAGRKYPEWVTQAKALHIVRHPLRCCESLQAFGGWTFAERHTPIDLHNPLELVAMQYWVRWNELCAAYAELTVPIEEIDQPATHRFFGRKIDFTAVPTDCNHRRYTPFDWGTVFERWPTAAEELKVAALRYGYKI